MKVVIAPGDFPTGLAYKIFGTGPRSRHLRRLLEVIRPDSRCLGLAGDLQEAGGGEHTVVLVDADWAATEEQLLSAGFSPDRLILFPIAEKDFWGYWDFSIKYIDRLVGNDGAVSFSLSDFAGYIADLGRLKVNGDEVEIPTWAYASYMKDALLPHQSKIALVRDQLANRQSRVVLDRIFEQGPRGQWQYYWEHCFGHVQYFDYLSIKPGDVIINGGVLGGYEVPIILAHLQGEGQVHNVDPLGDDYLSDYARTSIEHFAPNVFGHRLAFSDRRGTLRLPVSEDEHGAQAIGKFRDQPVQDLPLRDFPCLTVDQFVSDNQLDRVDLIKFDLEGAEEYVLPGTLATVERFRPQLAVSIYHKVEHIWDLPLFLMERLSDYHFYLDIYSFERFEIILYCIPHERPVRRPGPVEVPPPRRVPALVGQPHRRAG
jgi:FkbM family methyltransferase